MFLRNEQSTLDIQLLNEEEQHGRGIRIQKIAPAHTTYTFAGMQEDIGSTVCDPLVNGIIGVLKTKSEKLIKAGGLHAHDHWWLVLDDEVSYGFACSLTSNERAEIIESVKNFDRLHLWDKVVLVSRFIANGESFESPIRFCSIWERSECEKLPDWTT